MMPKKYRPMLATLVSKPFNDKRWVFETKWDGFRMIAEIKKGGVTLYSRNGIAVNQKYPSIAGVLEKIKHDAVFDGELVALDAKGVSRFQLLQNALNSKTRLRYYVFDMLFLDGKDMRKLPLIERKARLRKILPKSRLLAYSQHRSERGTVCFKEARKKKEEGVMAKRAAGLYYSGKRTREWLKIKTGHQQEVVIVGFTKPRRSRKYFGSLVLAVREKNRWRYAGRAGTGFDAASLKRIHAKLLPLVARGKPISENIPGEKDTTWVRPALVGEVKFSEWTAAGEMRHPAFLGLRDDKPAREVIREREKKI